MIQAFNLERNNPTALLWTCRQTRHEATNILLTTTIFNVRSDPLLYLCNLAEGKRRLITSIELGAVTVNTLPYLYNFKGATNTTYITALTALQIVYVDNWFAQYIYPHVRQNTVEAARKASGLNKEVRFIRKLDDWNEVDYDLACYGMYLASRPLERHGLGRIVGNLPIGKP
jgi:hypothetical protein